MKKTANAIVAVFNNERVATDIITMKATKKEQSKARQNSYRATTANKVAERTATTARFSKAEQNRQKKAEKAHKEIIRKAEQLKKNREKKAVNDSVKRETLKEVFARIALMTDSDIRFMKDSSTAVRFFNKVQFRVAITNSKLYRIYSINAVTDFISDKFKFETRHKSKSTYTALLNLTEQQTVECINEMLAVIC